MNACPPLRAALLSLLALSVAACMAASDTTDAGATTDTPPRADAGPSELTIGPVDRPALIALPTAHDGTTPLPLVFLLHGFTADAALQDGYLGVSRAARSRGLYVVLPNGTIDSRGDRFWNATDACCDRDGTGIDDVAYLEGLLDEAIATVPVDEARVYFMGHSNGGFMSYRMACEASGRIAAIAPLAGADFADPTRCVPTMPVSVLHWHGTLDDTVLFGGGPGTPSALTSVSRWAGYAGCDPTGVAGTPLDLSVLAGDETVVTEWSAGCTPGFSATLWAMAGESHLPGLERGTTGLVLDWLLSHRR